MVVNLISEEKGKITSRRILVVEYGWLNIYIQIENPGGDKESNCLPATTDNFSLLVNSSEETD